MTVHEKIAQMKGHDRIEVVHTSPTAFEVHEVDAKHAKGERQRTFESFPYAVSFALRQYPSFKVYYRDMGGELTEVDVASLAVI